MGYESIFLIWEVGASLIAKANIARGNSIFSRDVLKTDLGLGPKNLT